MQGSELASALKQSVQLGKEVESQKFNGKALKAEIQDLKMLDGGTMDSG